MSLRKSAQLHAALCGIVLSIGATPSTTRADVQAELNQMFGNMTNYTAPGSYETARRGVLSGGSIKSRNKITDEPIVNFQMPSYQAGCGGIDMFAGSFSFINADQFVQTLRSVASNASGVASGYAFQLAIDAMCETCSKNMSELQKKMQELNSLASNSCQIAQGLVVDTMAAFGDQQSKKDSVKGLSQGISDVFGSWSPSNNSSNKSAREQLSSANKLEPCKDKGNILWCAMESNAVSTYFTYADAAIQEQIMSLAGSMVIGDLAQAPDNKGTSPRLIPLPPRPGFTMDVLVNGSKDQPVDVYDCQADPVCANPVVKKIVIKGLAEQIADEYTRPQGILDKFATNSADLTPTQKALVASARGTQMGPMVVNIVQKNRDVAATFVQQYAPLLAASLVEDLMREMLGAAQVAVSTSLFPQAKEVEDMLEKARVNTNQQYLKMMAEKGGGLNGMIANYNQIMTAMAPTYLPTPAPTKR